MDMKIGWGTGIALFYSIFVISLLLQLKKSRQYDHSLVTDTYYAEDLAYQQQYDKKANSQSLANRLKLDHLEKGKYVRLQFPNGFEQIDGTIHFFRPSSSHEDFEVGIDVDQSNRQIVETMTLSEGLWRIKVDWQAGESAFYDEISIVL